MVTVYYRVYRDRTYVLSMDEVTGINVKTSGWNCQCLRFGVALNLFTIRVSCSPMNRDPAVDKRHIWR